jgi:hypothetical protein
MLLDTLALANAEDTSSGICTTDKVAMFYFVVYALRFLCVCVGGVTIKLLRHEVQKTSTLTGQSAKKKGGTVNGPTVQEK